MATRPSGGVAFLPIVDPGALINGPVPPEATTFCTQIPVLSKELEYHAT